MVPRVISTLKRDKSQPTTLNGSMSFLLDHRNKNRMRFARDFPAGAKWCGRAELTELRTTPPSLFIIYLGIFLRQPFSKRCSEIFGAPHEKKTTHSLPCAN